MAEEAINVRYFIKILVSKLINKRGMNENEKILQINNSIRAVCV